MSFLDILHKYIRGEKLEAFGLIVPVGILLVILSITAIKAERDGFAWGVAVAAILMGVMLIGTGIGVGAWANGQVAALEQVYRDKPAAMVEEELPRMDKGNANYRLTYLCLAS